jgi:hypothetical protein
VAELERLLQSSDELVAKAIAAKDEVESTLVQQCVALVNAKKAEISRLLNSSQVSRRGQRDVVRKAESDEEAELSEDMGKMASQAYSRIPVTQTHVSAKQVLEDMGDDDDDFLNML